MIAAFFVGFLTGFSLSIPIGPINLTVINEAFRKGFPRAFLIGLGGVTADTFYCVMAFFGFSPLLAKAQYLWPVLQFFGGVVVLTIGVRYSFLPQVPFSGMTQKTDSHIEHFKKAFPIGFVLGISNFALFVLWCGVSALLISHGWVKPSLRSVLISIFGIALGSTTWFFLIALLISKLHRQVSSETISFATRICGFLLLVFGVFLCYHSFLGKHPVHFNVT